MIMALAANASPAQASGTILVDDDGANCRTSIHTIHEALAAAQASWPWTGTKTIMVCAGTYTEPSMTISGVSNLKLIARRGVTVRSDGSSFVALMMVSGSSNVTVQGFTFDGQMALSTTTAQRAIQFSSTSGAIVRNSIVNWHTDTYGLNGQIVGIYAGSTTGQAVKIDHNTLTNYQDDGIWIDGAVNTTITNNALLGGAPQYGMFIQADSGAPTGTIRGNKLVGPGQISSSTGIHLLEGNNFRISGNAIGHWGIGLAVVSQCNSASSASHNRVTGNTIQDVDWGIKLAAVAGSCDANVDGNVVQGNRVVNLSTPGTYGISVTAADLSAAPPAATALADTVRGNTITNFTTPEYLAATGFGDLTGTVFSGDHIH